MRTLRGLLATVTTALMMLALTGCGGIGTTPLPQPGARTAPPAAIRLGVVPTEDILPLWAAQQGTLDKMGLQLQLVEFSSAGERDAAFRAGSIDGYVGDIFTAARMQESGVKNRIVTVCLGVTPSQGRYGIVVAPGSRIRLRSQLTQTPIATSGDSIDEFVLDGLMRSALADWPAAKHYVDKPSERMALVTSGKEAAAILPEPYLSLAIRRHSHLIADDTRGTNLSQTVMAFSDAYLARPEGASAVERLLGVWDAASTLVNSKRKLYRPLLVQKARFPATLKLHYRMNTYPHHKLPTQQEVSAVLAWMQVKGLLQTLPAYADITWTP